MTSGVGEGELNFDNLLTKTDSQESSSDGNIAFQLFEGEEMDAKMANFIGIHMLNDLIEEREDGFGPFGGDHESDSGAEDLHHQDSQYQDPETGCHFQYADLVRRIKVLQRRRAIIDKAIEEENQRCL